jgi:hypothetical protein
MHIHLSYEKFFSLLVQFYNSGYQAGHEDTVEACFTPIHQSDKDFYHAEEVAELLEQLAPSYYHGPVHSDLLR